MTENSGLFAMADVSAKAVTTRRALAGGEIVLGAEAFDLVVNRKLPKGDALVLAEIAGIQGAKQTPTLIPLCHPINLNRVIVRHHPVPQRHAIAVYCLADIAERTGVEMEALTGASVALLTLWDLAKPIEAALKIQAVTLRYKSGGKSGEWIHPDGLEPFAKDMLGLAP
ncbi:MAG: cyclic pyranopterin monophosphate synthase MoaC [Lysobacterales bacterium]